MKAFLAVFLFFLVLSAGAQDKPATPGSSPSGLNTAAPGTNGAPPGQGPAAPKNPDYLIALGVGASWLDYQTTQNSVDASQVNTSQQFNLASEGLEIFADVTKYFTVRAGVRWGTTAIVNFSTTSVTNTTTRLTNDTLNLEWGCEVKYPLFPFPQISIAPKIGWGGLAYLGGSGLSGYFSNASTARLLSPVWFSYGLDLNAYLFDQFLIRIPVECAWGLNNQLPDYGTNTYSQSSLGVFRIGLDLGMYF